MTFSDLPTGTYSVCEVLQGTWYNSDPGGSVPAGKQPCQTVTVTKGGTATETFGNYQKTKVKIIKKVDGGAMLPEDGSITFTLRTGAGPGQQGTTIGTAVVNSGNNGEAFFASDGNAVQVVPGTYQVCEVVPDGYDTSVRNVDWDGDGKTGDQEVYGHDWFYPTITNPNDPAQSSNDTTVVCFPITIKSGDDTDPNDGSVNTVVLTINNGRPALQRTIGYWKNWNSCAKSGGSQEHILDYWLAQSGGFLVGDLPVDTCSEAVSLLSKKFIGASKPTANNPILNFASQYVAFKSNLAMGSPASCTVANQAAAAGQAILAAIDFTGTSRPLTKTQATALNNAAGVLDHYNNDTLAGC